MKKLAFVISICFYSLISSTLYSQEYRWYTLPNSPVGGSRYSDCYFINPNTGWICSEDVRKIYKTSDGGDSWIEIGLSNTSDRCIAFTDSLTGFLGVYNNSNLINRTTDGGHTWELLTLPLPNSTGSCGFSVVNRSVIYGCGRYEGPARVIKSTNGGNNWSVIEMSGYASGLIDCYFTSPDSGIVVGKSGSPTKGIVLNTYDGGVSWDTSYITTNILQWGWKITFPTRDIGYVSLQDQSGSNNFLKTTNGGRSWVEKQLSGSTYNAQGIGFINPSTGWIGGWENFTYETTNGGDNWHVLDTVGTGGWANNINRYRFFGDTLGYAVGKRVYKYKKTNTISINNNEQFAVNSMKLYQNYPNPFNPVTKIKIEMPRGGNVNIEIYDMLGKMVGSLIEGTYLPAGIHEFDWDASNYPSGVYYYRIVSENIELSKSMVLIR